MEYASLKFKFLQLDKLLSLDGVFFLAWDKIFFSKSLFVKAFSAQIILVLFKRQKIKTSLGKTSYEKIMHTDDFIESHRLSTE